MCGDVMQSCGLTYKRVRHCQIKLLIRFFKKYIGQYASKKITNSLDIEFLKKLKKLAIGLDRNANYLIERGIK